MRDQIYNPMGLPVEALPPPIRRKIKERQSTKVIKDVRNIRVRLNQQNNVYELYVPALGYNVAEFVMPRNGQIVMDVVALERVAQELDGRYSKSSKCKAYSCSDLCENNMYSEILFVQTDISKYEFYLPNRQFIGWIITPSDGAYRHDIEVIKETCKALARRYSLI